MTPRYCTHCGNPFQPRPQVPRQSYCSHPECQRARKQLWQQQKLRTDPHYRDNQRDAQRKWHERHPDYWRNYRASHREHAEGSPARQSQPMVDRIRTRVKMDVSALTSGLYRIRIIQPVARAPAGSLIAEITPV